MVSCVGLLPVFNFVLLPVSFVINLLDSCFVAEVRNSQTAAMSVYLLKLRLYRNRIFVGVRSLTKPTVVPCSTLCKIDTPKLFSLAALQVNPPALFSPRCLL